MLDSEVVKLIVVDEVGPTAARVGPFTRTLLPAYRRPPRADAYFIGSEGENVIKSPFNPSTSPEDDYVTVPLFTVAGPIPYVRSALGERVVALLECISLGVPGTGDAPAGKSIFDSIESFREFAEASLELPVAAILVGVDTLGGQDDVVQWDGVAQESGESTWAYALTAEALVLVTGSPPSPLEGTDPGLGEQRVTRTEGGPIQADFGLVAWSGRSVVGVVRL